MFSPKVPEHYSALENQKIFLKMKKMGKKNKDAAYLVATFCLSKQDIYTALFWFNHADRLGHPLACEGIAELHIHCVSHKYCPTSTFMDAASFSLKTAETLLKGRNTRNAAILRTHISVLTQDITKQTYIDALLGYTHDDISCSIILQGCLCGIEDVLQGRSMIEALEDYCRHVTLKQSAFMIGQAMVTGKLPTPFLDHDALHYIKLAANAMHPEALFHYGRHLYQTGEQTQGETALKHSLKLGFALSGVFLADAKTHEGQGDNPETLRLYVQAAELNHVGAQCVVAIRQWSGMPMGVSEKRCQHYYQNALKHHHPLALKWEHKTRL